MNSETIKPSLSTSDHLFPKQLEIYTGYKVTIIVIVLNLIIPTFNLGRIISIR